ncbi:MAG: tetratricopeptide repeat protein, partial [bacterium]
MLTLRRCVVVAVLLVSGVALAQPPTPTELAELRVDAQAGDAVAQNNLGVAYFSGAGVPQDYAQAVSWWRKAADQGHAGAQNNLGVAYRYGQGVPQDFVESH